MVIIVGTSASEQFTLIESSVIRAGEGNDTVMGSDFNDSINGEDGDDSLIGGNGNDIIIRRESKYSYL